MKTKLLNKKIALRIQNKLKKLNSLRPMPKSAVKKLQEQMQIEMTYNSNGIEGNSLTMKETFLVINEGITVKNKPLKDHLEAKNHQEALGYLYELIDNRKKNTISEVLIRNLHKLILKQEDEEWAGVYRNSNVIIGGSDHTPPDALEVSMQMKQLLDWLKTKKKEMNIIELSAILHHKLVYIHPFFDGNGRTARLAMNLLLMQAGFPLVIILKNDRKKYYSVLDKADKKDYKPLVNFVAQAIERSLDLYLKAVTPSSNKTEKYLTLSELSKLDGISYSAKYLNLLMRQGKIGGHKDGRNWVSKKEEVIKYIKERDRKRKLKL